MNGGLKTIIRIVIAGLTICILLVIPGTLPTIARSQVNQRLFRSDFRYVILSDEIENAGGKHRTRSVQVLLDPNAFSEQNLKRLFELLLKRYPNPDWMSVSVVTRLEQVATPEEAEREITMSHTNNHPEFDNYNHAVLIRHGENEFFRYTIKAPGTELTTVVIKGCDAATSKCAH